MKSAMMYHQIKNRDTGSKKIKDIILLAFAALLITFGCILSTEQMASTIVGNTAVHYQEVVKGAFLFKIALLLNGLVLAAIGIYFLIDRRVKEIKIPPLLRINGMVKEEATNLRAWMPLLIILVLAIPLRLYGLNSCLWYDEVATLVEFVRLPVFQLLTTYGDQNNHPLFSLMAHACVGLFGENAWALRMPALLFGLASLWALFLLARIVTDRREAILATLLMAVSYHHVWFSQNARGYTGLLFWGLLSTWLFIKGCRKSTPLVWAGYAASMALGMYTHLTTVFVLASHVMIFFFLILWQRRFNAFIPPMTWYPIASFLLVALFSFQLYALILPQVVESFQVQVGGGRVEVWTNPFWAIIEVIRGLRIGFGTFVGVVIAFIIFLCGLASYAKSNQVVIWLFVIPIVIGSATLLALHRHFYPRFFFFELGIGILLLIRGTTVISKVLVRWIKDDTKQNRIGLAIGTTVASMVIVVSFLSLYHNYRYPKQDYLGALDFIEENRNEADIIITAGHTSYPYKNYYAPHLITIESIDEMQNIVSQNRPVWLIYSFPDHLEAFYPGMLSIIQELFTVIRKFPGTLGGGTLFVCRSDPAIANRS